MKVQSLLQYQLDATRTRMVRQMEKISLSPWMTVSLILLAGLALTAVNNFRALTTYFWDEDDLVYVSLGYSNDVPDYLFSSWVQNFPRPVTHLYSWMIALFSGISVWPYFLANMLLHTISAYLLYVIVRKLFDSGFMAITAGLFFLICPCTADSFYWYAAGATTFLSTALLLGSINLFLEAKRPDSTYHRKTLAFSVFLGLLAFGAKEATVILPLLIILMACITGTRAGKALKLAIPFLVLSLLFGLYVLSVQLDNPESGNLTRYGLSMQCVRNLVHFVTYPLVGSLPFRNGVYTLPKLIIYPALWTLSYLLGSSKTKKVVSAGLFFVLISSLPYLPWKEGTGFFPEVCDIPTRYFYLPMAGAAIVVSGFLQMLREKTGWKMAYTVACAFLLTTAITGRSLTGERATFMLHTAATRSTLQQLLLNSWDGNGALYVGYFGFHPSTIASYNALYFNGNLIMYNGVPQGVPPGTQMITGPVMTPVLSEFDGIRWSVGERFPSCVSNIETARVLTER